jgi:CHAD domain-containing protein/adenylate cyclase class IV
MDNKGKIRASSTWGEAALHVFAQEIRRILKHEAGTRLGEDAEELHQMRVGTRRLRSALRLFEPAMKLPKHARRRAIGTLAQVLGSVRDLDVQIEMLQGYATKSLPEKEEIALTDYIAHLAETRDQQRSVMTAYLNSEDYRQFRAASESYIESPCFRRSGEEPLYNLLPALLKEQFETLWVHPGWGEPDSETLHALRIAVKRVRYILEFFLDCYGKGMRSFYQELKRLQEDLGIIHDCDVLTGVLQQTGKAFPRLNTRIRQERRNALRRFRRLREKLTHQKSRSAVAAWAGWPGTQEDTALFAYNRKPLGALELEHKFRLVNWLDIEAKLKALHFRVGGPILQTDHYLEVLSANTYLRLRREVIGNQVRYLLCHKDQGPEGTRRAVEEPISAFAYEALLARSGSCPTLHKQHQRWGGFFEQVPFVISVDRIEGIGEYSGEYLELEVMVPDPTLLSTAQSSLERFSEHLGLTVRIEQSYVAMLLQWMAQADEPNHV